MWKSYYIAPLSAMGALAHAQVCGNVLERYRCGCFLFVQHPRAPIVTRCYFGAMSERADNPGARRHGAPGQRGADEHVAAAAPAQSLFSAVGSHEET